MADKTTAEAERAATEGFKEGQKAAKASTELASIKKENETLAKAKAAAERAYNAAIDRPNRIQLGIVVATAAVGTPIGFKANEFLERKTEKMVDPETGNKTGAGKFVQHGIVPMVGAIGTVGGAFIKNGAVSSVVMGLFSGLAVGSIVRSVYKVPLPALPEAEAAP